jgi:hypothetical protein
MEYAVNPLAGPEQTPRSFQIAAADFHVVCPGRRKQRACPQQNPHPRPLLNQRGNQMTPDKTRCASHQDRAFSVTALHFAEPI